MRLLILGGTAEARNLAAQLVDDGDDVVSSLAGRVARPRLPVGGVRIGGFGGSEGLAKWLSENEIDAVIDATHPFAAQITRNASIACAQVAKPLVRVRRPPWTPTSTDQWVRVADMNGAADAVRSEGGRVFLTTGRQDVGVFADIADAWFLIRVVDPPTGKLPVNSEVLLARGPYGYDDEVALMRAHDVSTLVTKNSGGALTHAKLDAARDLGIRVVMVDRPPEPDGMEAVDTVDAAVDWLRHR